MIFTVENIKSLTSVYLNLTETILKFGEKISPRDNKETLEIRPVILEYIDPVNRCLFIKYRDINPFFLVVEALWILTGRETVFPLSLFNSRISEYSDDQIHFNAPYGNRLRRYGQNYKTSINVTRRVYGEKNEFLRFENDTDGIDQLQEVYHLLKNEPDTRRAVAVIWNPYNDLNKVTKDIPCNDLLLFKIRNGKLDLNLTNRSNDLHWGLPTNLFQFSFILEVMAYTLGIEVGTLYHNTDSLHIYIDNPITKKILSERARRYNLPDPYIDRVKAMKFSLNEKYLLQNMNRDRFQKVFVTLEEAMLFIENIDTLSFSLQERLIQDKNYMKVFEELFLNDFLYVTIKNKSEYVSLLLNFVMSYYFYKQGMKSLKNKVPYLAEIYFNLSLESIRQSPQDLFVLGLNFLHTRFSNAFESTLQSETLIESRKIFLYFQRRIKDLATDVFTNQSIINFILESNIGLDKNEAE